MTSTQNAARETPGAATNLADARERFCRDGVVHLRGALDPTWVDLIKLGIRRNVTNPGPYARISYEGTAREFLVDYCNYWTIPEYRMLLDRSPLVEMIAEVLDTESLWLFYEQIFVKEPVGDDRDDDGLGRRTPWHQDATYWITRTTDTQQCGCWMTVDETPAEASLEFVRGSHLGPTYGGSAFDPTDETIPFQPGYERIPDIEADRDAFDIVSFDITPGDLVIFHPNMLHGGGSPTTARRRTLSVRFFGDDVVYDPRARPEPPYPGHDAVCRPGEPLRGHWFPQLLGPGGLRPSTL